MPADYTQEATDAMHTVERYASLDHEVKALHSTLQSALLPVAQAYANATQYNYRLGDLLDVRPASKAHHLQTTWQTLAPGETVWLDRQVTFILPVAGLFPGFSMTSHVAQEKAQLHKAIYDQRLQLVDHWQGLFKQCQRQLIEVSEILRPQVSEWLRFQAPLFKGYNDWDITALEYKETEQGAQIAAVVTRPGTVMPLRIPFPIQALHPAFSVEKWIDSGDGLEGHTL